MSHNSKFSVIVRSLCLLFIAACSSQSYGQSDYWSIFSNSSASCNAVSRMSCNTSPSAITFASIPDINDPTPGTANNVCKGSVYNKSGQLLFSVNADGIYAPISSGDMVKKFFDHVVTPLTCVSGAGKETNTGASVSEIVTFPVPGECNSYYVVFWSYIAPIGSSHPYVLRAVKVHITENFGVTADVDSWYSITDELLDPPTCSTSGPIDHFFYGYGLVGGACFCF